VDATIFLGVVCGLAWCAGYICIIRDTPQVLTTVCISSPFLSFLFIS